MAAGPTSWRAVEWPFLMATESAGPPTLRATVYSRTLQRASEVLGGVEPLAKHLRVSPTQLAHWIDGRGQPPTEVFLAAVDVVLRTV